MKMDKDQVDLYNLIFFGENPLDAFIDPESPYHDYHLRVTSSEIYLKSMIRVSENRTIKWDMSQDQLLANTLIVYYASYFEMFANDSLIETFYGFFPVYCEEVLKGNANVLFKDLNGDTFLHYYAATGDVDSILKLKSVVEGSIGNVPDTLEMVNYSGESIKSILMLE